MSGDGFPIVLTADRTLMAGYRVLLEGMLACSQTTTTPGLLMKSLMAPALKRVSGSQTGDRLRAPVANLGLRRVEAALRRDGLGPDQVVVVAPRDLSAAIGPATRIVGLSSGDPLGLGMNSNTMTGIAGGRIYTKTWFGHLARRARALVRNPDCRIVAGGPGAWQLAQNDRARAGLGIDHVLTGYCESGVADLFRRLLAGESLPTVLSTLAPSVSQVPAILGPTVMGAVEVSRGCGLGCDFCTLAAQPMMHFPVDFILADALANLRAGVRDLSLVSEDFFRYGAQAPTRTDPAAVIKLLEGLRRLPDLRLLQLDHANVSSIAAYSDRELVRVHELLTAGSPGHLLWINLGVETASARLLAANGGGPKMRALGESDWADVCLEQVHRLSGAGFVPMVSLVLGLPGETPDDIRLTLDWVRRLRGERVTVFPMFLAPLSSEAATFGVRDMTRLHWQLFRECYRFNFKWIPRLFWDNQSRAGVGMIRRLMVQVMGRANVLFWKSLFLLRSRGARP